MSLHTQKPYSRQTARFLAAVAECMPELTAAQMQAWIQSPTILQKTLGVLDQPMVEGPRKIVRWRTITVGGMTADQLIEALKKVAKYPGDEDMVRACPVIEKPHLAHLVRITPRDIGFTKRPNLYALLRRAEEVDLSHHPAVGPYLRLAYFDQTVKDDPAILPSEPLPSENGGKEVWYMDRVEGEEEHPLFLGSTMADGSDGDIFTRPWQLDHPLVMIDGQMELFESAT